MRRLYDTTSSRPLGASLFINVLFNAYFKWQKTKTMTEQQMITITVQEHRRLISKSKRGWIAFYGLYDQLATIIDNAPIQQLVNRNEDLSHLKTQLINLIAQVHRVISCPVCLEELEKEEMIVLNCGHILCRDDHTRIKNRPNAMERRCPECRRDL